MAERIKNNVKIQIFCMTVWIYLVHIPATTGKKQVDFLVSGCNIFFQIWKGEEIICNPFWNFAS